MTEDHGTGRAWRGLPEEEQIRRLLAEAGPRPAPPEDDLAAITEAARAEWRRRYGGRREERPERGTETSERPDLPTAASEMPGGGAAIPRRPARSGAGRPALRWLTLAAAAAVIAALGVAWWAWRTPPVGAPPVASVEVVTGEVLAWLAGGDGPVSLSTGAPGLDLAAGSTVESASADGTGGPGRLALRTTGGASLRLDSGTRVHLASAERIELTRGAIYVDSGADSGGRPLAVVTPAGVFHELGTQFEVRVEGDGAETITRLRVREGRVALDGGGVQGTAAVLTAAGEELVVRADGRLVRGVIPSHGPTWEWVVATAPMLDIEGVPVRDFLDWIARETGLRVEFADAEAAAVADTVTLHGSIARLTPTQALGPVLSSAGIDHRVTDGTLLVSVADPVAANLSAP
jgi:hypothetical protein